MALLDSLAGCHTGSGVMRRNAAAFVRGRLLRTGMIGAMAGAVLLGLGLGLVRPYVEVVVGARWTWGVYILFALGLCVFGWVVHRPFYRWNVGNLEKGLEAETRVGQALEYAVTVAGCAFAHSVAELATVGDIDHIVATPQAVWVIETKARRVPRKVFGEVLRRLAVSTRAVRQHLPAGVPVRGCLVLAMETSVPARSYVHGEESFMVYTPKDLMRVLRVEAQASLAIDSRVAKIVWSLGRIRD